MTVTIKAVIMAAALTISAPVLAGQTLPKPFAAYNTKETVAISYADWSYILNASVFDAGPSDRAFAPPPRPGIGQHFVPGNKSSLRYEGNRFYFQNLKENGNLKKLHHIRRELEAMPGAVPMKEWTKNQQLAYWLNLYNITLIEALTRTYPEQGIQKLLYGHHGILGKKLLKVAGVRLSLNDIQYRILMQGWRDPLVMYGLFKGYVGCPNINREAFTAHNVWDMLKQNAVEFINSNRGARIDGTRLRVSEFYKENRALFPHWPDDLKAHLAKYADNYYAPRFRNADVVEATTHDYYIADLMQGIRYDSNPNAGNPAAFMGAANSMNAAQFEGWLAQKSGHAAGFHMTNLMMHYLLKIQKRKAARKGHVEVEEVQDTAVKAPDAQKPADDTTGSTANTAPKPE